MERKWASVYSLFLTVKSSKLRDVVNIVLGTKLIYFWKLCIIFLKHYESSVQNVIFECEESGLVMPSVC